MSSVEREPSAYKRRPARTVSIGDVKLGSDYPIRVQSMTVADTCDTAGTVRDVERLVLAGCELVRITVPTKADADNLPNIRAEMKRRGLAVPIIADIHFTPSVAMMVVPHVEKVRINPGNFVDKKRFKVIEYTDAAYQEELEKIYDKFAPLVKKCKEYGRAMRIGANHGSLSDRIMNRYGDTTAGMVESALEFARICEDLDFHNFVFSMKSSNPMVMIEAYRLLAQRLDALNMPTPFHLGVTEAGFGEDGRIKSAIGIGSLLEDGIGDTIRVSLTEDPEHEIPVAFDLVEKFNQKPPAARGCHPLTPNFGVQGNKLENSRAGERGKQRVSDGISELAMPPARVWDGVPHARRKTNPISLGALHLGGREPVRVGGTLPLDPKNIIHSIQTAQTLTAESSNGTPAAEFLSVCVRTAADAEGLAIVAKELTSTNIAIPFKVDVHGSLELAKMALPFAAILNYTPTGNATLETLSQQTSELTAVGRSCAFCFDVDALTRVVSGDPVFAKKSRYDQWTSLVKTLSDLATAQGSQAISFSLRESPTISDYRLLAHILDTLNLRAPIHLYFTTAGDYPDPVLGFSVLVGSLLCDGIGDSVELAAPLADPQALLLSSYNILQATGLRIFKADFVSCPSCGRTQFDLQTTTSRIKSKFGHLKGVKIAVMGCIVNGPGEMADAHFGYVGAGPKKIDLYVGKECVTRGIDESFADEKLQELIASHGQWVEMPI